MDEIENSIILLQPICQVFLLATGENAVSLKQQGVGMPWIDFKGAWFGMAGSVLNVLLGGFGAWQDQGFTKIEHLKLLQPDLLGVQGFQQVANRPIDFLEG